MSNTEHRATDVIPTGQHRITVRSTPPKRLAVAVAAITASLGGLASTSSVDAAMSGEAIVDCNGAYNTIEVTPRVLSDHVDAPQWTATRVWIATWNGATGTWGWESKPWKVELASERNSPIATDISRLETQRFTKADGYYYVYVESWMWNGSAWYGWDGDYTRSYTQVTPSVSHEPDSREQATYCTL